MGTWEPSQSPLGIQYDSATLLRINREVLTAFRALAHGGLEVGGVLFGNVEDNQVTVHGAEPVACEHAAGPSFVLSETDKSALEAKLGALNQRLAAEGQVVVGWYRSHTRSPLAMSTDDLTLHYRFFAERWQVALILKPQGHFSSRAGFFVREPGAAAMRTSSSYQEFPLAADFTELAVAPAPVQETAVERRRSAPMIEWRPVPRMDLAVAGKSDPFPEQSQQSRWAVWATLATMFLLAMGAIGFMRMHYGSAPAPAIPGHLRLEAERRGGNLEVNWNPRELGQAKEGRLEIQDGGLRGQLTLDPKTLMSGTLSYAVKSDVTGFNLTVERLDGSRLSGSTTYVGTNIPAEPAKPVAVEKKEPEPSDAKKTEESARAVKDDDSLTAKSDSATDAADRLKTPPIEPRALSAAEIMATPAAPVNLKGSWTLQPGASTRSPALPETVNIHITDRDGNIRGTFEGRYRTAESKTERMNFAFSGRIENGVARFPWAGKAGERGQIEFIRHSGDMLEVVFYGPDAKVYDHVVHKVR